MANPDGVGVEGSQGALIDVGLDPFGVVGADGAYQVIRVGVILSERLERLAAPLEEFVEKMLPFLGVFEGDPAELGALTQAQSRQPAAKQGADHQQQEEDFGLDLHGAERFKNQGSRFKEAPRIKNKREAGNKEAARRKDGEHTI